MQEKDYKIIEDVFNHFCERVNMRTIKNLKGFMEIENKSKEHLKMFYFRHKDLTDEEMDILYKKADSKKRSCKSRWVKMIDPEISQIYIGILKEYQKNNKTISANFNFINAVISEFEIWKNQKSKMLTDMHPKMLEIIGIKKAKTAILIDIEIYLIEYLTMSRRDVSKHIYANKKINQTENIKDYSIRPASLSYVPFFGADKIKFKVSKSKSNNKYFKTFVSTSKDSQIELNIGSKDIQEFSKIKSLDDTDMKILDFLTLFSFEQISNALKTSSFSLNELREVIFPKYRTKVIYQKVEDRLINIANFSYEITKKNLNGEELERISFSFIDSVRIIKNKDGKILKPKDYEVRVRLGHKFLMEFSRSTLIMLYGEELNKIDNPLSRIISHYIALDRLKKITKGGTMEFNYTPDEISAPIAYMKKITQREKIKILTEALLDMQNNGFLIKEVFFDGEEFFGQYLSAKETEKDKSKLFRFGPHDDDDYEK